MVEDAVGPGEIIYWEDVAERLVLERDKDGDQEVTHAHKRRSVKGPPGENHG